jgi:two-component system sensor histidine kinase/response regulator
MAVPKENSKPADGEILIVEDSPTQAEKLGYILEKQGYRVSFAANGREALAFMDVRKPALIISDIVMPEMDGYELCRKVKSDQNCRNIPIILLTSLSDPCDVIKGLECGADNFITKPIEDEYLLSRITEMQAEPCRSGWAQEEGLPLHFGGRDYLVKADRSQILNMFLSTYETAVRKNRELSQARDELHEVNEKLKAANRELEAFSFTVSHDLRSPLNVISLYVQELAGLCDDRQDDRFHDNLQVILAQVDRMDQLITTLLGFSRISRGDLRLAIINLSEMVREIAGQLAMKEPERRVQFFIAEGITVVGDARLLRVAMENLLGNAWKYTGRKPDAVIEFGMEEEAEKMVYYVRDNGAGFDMDMADRLFKPFTRLHDREEFDGNGIGLASVQRIIHRHGGELWAEGEVGKGAVFYFTLGMRQG